MMVWIFSGIWPKKSGSRTQRSISSIGSDFG
jgi:hypothetical protein